jgi:tetratricopeptide (TPR) repeat protein
VCSSDLGLSSAQTVVTPEARGRVGYEEVIVNGWGAGCSVAIRHFRYPPAAEGTQMDPNWGRLGTVTLEPDKRQPTVNWFMQVKDGSPYYKGWMIAAEDQLSRAGYETQGFYERVRPDPVAPNRDLEPLIKSTASLRVGYTVAYASAPYALSRVYYSPLGNCAFLVFERPGYPPNLFKYQLVRVPVEVRRERAQAHLTNALLLYKNLNDVYGALEEAATAASMDPRLAEARYHHAAMLAVHGRFEDSLKELREAVQLDPNYGKVARKAIEFEDLWKQPRFKQAIEVKPGSMPLNPR